MLGLTDLKTGRVIELEGAPYLITYHEHSKMGRSGAVMRTRLKNLETGATLERTFKPVDKVGEASLDKKEAQYLYQEGALAHLMDSTSFEQFGLPSSEIADALRYMREGENYQLVFFQGRPISVELPAKVVLEVRETEPGEKGNSATASTKPARLETGLTIQVPLFIKTGDRLRVDTRTGQYIERV